MSGRRQRTRRGGQRRGRAGSRSPQRPGAAADGRRQLALTAVTALEGGLITNVVGPLHLPGAIGDFAGQHPVPLLAAGVVAGLAVLGWVARGAWRRRRAGAGASPAARPDAGSRLLLGLSVLSGVSTLTAVSLIVLVAVRSPLLLGSGPAATAGPHDANLEVRLTAVQASDFLIPGDPAVYSLARLPAASGASATVVEPPVTGAGPAIAAAPYRIVLAVHDLQTGGSGMFIEAVSLRVVSAGPIPAAPIRAWYRPAPLDYRTNPYAARYTGQAAGQSVAAGYAGAVPAGHVQLSPGESDELTVGVTSSVDASVRFQVEIAYRLSDQLKVRRFTLPLSFSAVFAEDIYLVRYTLTDGRFVAS